MLDLGGPDDRPAGAEHGNGGRPGRYGTPTMFTAGQILDAIPGGVWETLLGGNITALSGSTLTGYQTGSDGAATGNA